jgi:hypothetical protein
VSPHDNPLPSTGPASPPEPVEIVLIYWTIDLYPDPMHPVIEINFQKSGRYGSSYLGRGIFPFAQDVASGDVDAPPMPLYLDPTPDTQNFVIKKPCYVVFALEQDSDVVTTPTQWQFWRQSPALTDGDDPIGKYFALNHVVSGVGAPVPGTTPNIGGCQVSYFSAIAISAPDFIIDHLNIYVEYQYNNSTYGYRVDPAIKNKGHRSQFIVQGQRIA